MKKKNRILLITISIIILLFIVSFLYFNDYYKADKSINKYLTSNVIKKENYYFIDGPSNNEAIIFYPGAKVESTSYIPLLYKLSQEGPDCFLVTMPLNIAFFNPNAAKKIINDYKYDTWYMMGHSLGGVVATSFANNSKDIKGLIFLASYPNEKVKDNIRLLSIYGTKDKVLNNTKYNESKKNWPSQSKEIIIDGANHANYGNYGHQKGDGKASISIAKQQEQTIKAIINFIKEGDS